MLYKNTKAVIVALFVLALAIFAVTGKGQTLLSKTLALTMVPAEEIVVAEDAVDMSLIEELRQHPTQVPLLTPDQVDEETLWMARCIYSETKKPVEQELVAWVLRNRVETGYRGARTYKQAVTQPYQFSAFNPESRVRRYYSGLEATSKAPGFQRALAIAYAVRNADESRRPFVETTRHFFSQQSMVGGRFPAWSKGRQPVDPNRVDEIAPERFRFYADVN